MVWEQTLHQIFETPPEEAGFPSVCSQVQAICTGLFAPGDPKVRMAACFVYSVTPCGRNRAPQREVLKRLGQLMDFVLYKTRDCIFSHWFEHMDDFYILCRLISPFRMLLSNLIIKH